MAEPNSTVFFVGGCIGIGLMLLGGYALRRWNLAMPIRVGLGVAMLGAGLVAWFVWPGLSTVVQSPVYLGLSVVLVGLGINQAAAPLRRALGKAV